jgi:hypothetical protein
MGDIGVVETTQSAVLMIPALRLMMARQLGI